MTAKEMLKQVKLYDVNIQNKLVEIQNLRNLVTSITSSLESEPVSGTKNNDKIGSIIARIVDMERELDQDIDRYVDFRQHVSKIIEKMKEPIQIQVLRKRYFEYESWVEISNDLGFSYQWICKIHGRALQAMERIMRE